MGDYMSEIILNLLPLREDERECFLSAAPGLEQRFFPLIDFEGEPLSLSVPIPTEGVTAVLGNLSPSETAKLSTLRWLQTWTAGVDSYLLPGKLPEGAMLTSAVGAYGPAVSEHMFAALLTLFKRLHQYRDNQLAGIWENRGRVKTLVGATVLVVGAGDIGTRFAALCKAVGAYTVGLKRTPCPPPPGLDEVHTIDELDLWLPKADVVALVLPHSPETIHLMDRRRFSLMKEDSVLLNGGRGSAVDPEALLEALRSGKLWGASLDVTEPEPLPTDSPLWKEAGLLLTPHVAGGFQLQGTRERIVDIALENLTHFLDGEPLRNRMK